MGNGSQDIKRCPFYGFYNTSKGEVFVYSGGIQCALDTIETTRYSLCKMQVSGREPDWNFCHRNNGEDSLPKNIESTVFLSNAFSPEDTNEWNDVPFFEWYEYVMSRRR